jgi:PBSX family phage terminase large subunit
MTTATQEYILRYIPRGVASDVFGIRDPEVVLDGPAGTGKSLALLMKLHLAMLKYPSARGLILRKTRRSLTESAMVTYWDKIRPDLDGVVWKSSAQQYQYPNGAIIAVGGLDKPSKIMSSEWDMIYVQEATEIDENDWESCTVRLRNGKMPYQQLLADCNPDAPGHWLKQRANAGKTLMLESRHEDNPILFSDDAIITKEGERYLGTLDALSGVRYSRLRLGLWAAAEGTVYEDSWDRARNVVQPFVIPQEWPRYLWIDFGFTNPFTCYWAAQDPDGRLVVYREIYKTKTLVEDHAKEIKRLSRWGAEHGEPLPRAIICDHDAEDRATLERHLGLRTLPAQKNVSAGIQAMASRLRKAGDDKPRLMYFSNLLVDRDRELADKKLPCSVLEEFESYIWDTRNGAKIGDVPLKQFDHGMDACRYGVAYFDLIPSNVSYSQRVY